MPDADGDGRWDFLVKGNNNGNLRVYLFSGASSELLAEIAANPPGLGMAALPDVNGDGRAEIVIASNSTEEVYLYLSDSPPPPPEPSVVGREEEGVVIRLTGKTGTKYELQASDNLTNWTAVTQGTLTNEVTEFLETSATNQSMRFYRTQLLP